MTRRAPTPRRPEADIEPRSSFGSTSRTRQLDTLRTIPETAEILRISERTVRRLIASGELRAHRGFRRRLVRIADADIAGLLDATRTV
jgi:excisionase family DNA binding protein